MGETSNIEWTDATFNPWIGCTKISPACDNCYAADWAKRFGEDVWGNKPRRRTIEKRWNEPRRWNRQADNWEAVHGRPRFVFCASLADVFDNQVPTEWRDDLWKLIKECDRLVWLLLTKRPQNIRKMLPADWGEGYANVWLGTTIENQEVADRNISELLSTPASKRFLSIEPIVGPIDLTHVSFGGARSATFAPGVVPDGIDKVEFFINALRGAPSISLRGVDWVITGGESGPNARPSHPDWYRTIRDQCVEANVPFHFKQWGEWIEWNHHEDGPTVHIMDEGSFQVEDAIASAKHPGFLHESGTFFETWDDVTTPHARLMDRVGKKAAGRLLDGRTWDERPLP